MDLMVHLSNEPFFYIQNNVLDFIWQRSIGTISNFHAFMVILTSTITTISSLLMILVLQMYKNLQELL